MSQQQLAAFYGLDPPKPPEKPEPFSNNSKTTNSTSPNNSKNDGMKKTPFIPCNAARSRELLISKGPSLFVGDPYDGALETRKEERIRNHEIQEKVSTKPFIFSRASDAKTLIEVDYYLNSADQPSKKIEKEEQHKMIQANISVLKSKGYGKAPKKDVAQQQTSKSVMSPTSLPDPFRKSAKASKNDKKGNK
eukprot:PhF_6_TR40371/c2_g1_i2/m.60102